MTQNNETDEFDKKMKTMSSQANLSLFSDKSEKTRPTTKVERNGGGVINLSEQTSTPSYIIQDTSKELNSFVRPYKDFYKRPFLKGVFSSFSLQVNLSHLLLSRRHPDEHVELEVLEGVRVLTMFWGIFTATSLYILTAHVNNIWYMLVLFDSIAFTMVASGNLAPNLMIFFIAFLSFYKLHVLTDKLKGLDILTYINLIGYRLFKYIPIYYACFFFGWICLPYLSSATTWYISETLFNTCDKYWWSTLLFISNYYPWFVEGLSGCFYWPFVILIDLQLYFFIPLIVVICKLNKIVFHILMSLILVGGMIGLFFIFWNKKLSVGVLTLENYYLYSENFNKAYTKFPSFALGIWFAYFYLQIEQYRKSKTKEEWRILHWIYTSKVALVLLALYSALALNLTTLVTFEENKDAYKWTKFENSLYNALCQPGYCTAVMAFLTILFTERLRFLSAFLSMQIWRPFSRVTIIAYIIYPMVILGWYAGLDEPVYLSLVNVIYFLLHNIITTYLFSFAIYLLFYGPILTIMRISISKMRGHEAHSFLYVKHKHKQQKVPLEEEKLKSNEADISFEEERD